jgi:hypothetical protein
MPDRATRKQKRQRSEDGNDKPAVRRRRSTANGHDQGIVKDERGQDQPADKRRALQNR